MARRNAMLGVAIRLNVAIHFIPPDRELAVLLMIDPCKILANVWIASKDHWFDIPLHPAGEPIIALETD